MQHYKTRCGGASNGEQTGSSPPTVTPTGRLRIMMLTLIATLAIAVSVFSIPIDPCDTMRCKEGMSCVDGKCMSNSTECGKNMEFKECGTACPTKCGVTALSTKCIMVCVRGCFCKSGFILAQDGESCIATTDCQPSTNSGSDSGSGSGSELCDLNEEFKKCGLNTEPSCSNPNPSSYSLRCLNTNVCQCSDGFYRDSNKACVSSLQCIQSAGAS